MTTTATTAFGMPTTSWKLQFFARTPEAKGLLLLVAAPILWFTLAALFSAVTWKDALVLWGIGVAVGYVIRSGGRTTHIADLKGKTALVTGGNTGIGAENVRQLAEMGARVILLCRDVSKGEATRAAVIKRLPAGSAGSVEVRALDLSSKASIKAFVAKLQDEEKSDVHILINNAGVMMCPYSTTADGFEMQVGTNHLGHMYLTVLLLPTLKRCGARIVNVSSIGHALYSGVPATSWAKALSPSSSDYDKSLQYGNSKLANILFTRTLESKLGASGAHAYCGHPGAVRTELARHTLSRSARDWVEYISFLIFKTPEEGAQTQLYLATHPEARPVVYHSDCAVAESSPISYSDASAAELWAESCKLLGLQA